MRHHLFDFQADCCLMVPGDDETQARERLATLIDCAETNFGAWPDGDPAVGEVSINQHRAILISVNGVPTDSGRFDLAASHVQLTQAVELALDFMAGFEGDEMQDGINDRLQKIRAALAYAKGEAVPAVTP